MDSWSRKHRERAYRGGFLAAARQAARWDEPDWPAAAAACAYSADTWRLACHARCADLRPDRCHPFTAQCILDAARARGEFHALDAVCLAWKRPEAQHLDMPAVLALWLPKVILWAAQEPLREPFQFPPRPDDDWLKHFDQIAV